MGAQTNLPETLFKSAAESLPCFMLILDRDGDLLYVSPSFREFFHVRSSGTMMRVFNIHKAERALIQGHDVSGLFQRALSGEVTYTRKVAAPVKDIAGEFGEGYLDPIRHLSTVCMYPIKENGEAITAVGVLFFPECSYVDDSVAAKCREWIDAHWQEPFDLAEVSELLNVSEHHLHRLFKRAFGISPFTYYHQAKIEQIKTCLADPAMSIAQAFTACGLSYSGAKAQYFKRYTGFTPSGYRKWIKEAAGELGPKSIPK